MKFPKQPERIGGIFCKSSQYMLKKPMWGLSRCIMANKDDYHLLVSYGKIKF